MRQKVTTALASGSYPDIAYIFGSDLANLARSDKVLDLTDDVKKPDFGWDDYYAPARTATTVDGKVRALPALIDDLAVVYNKKLFKQMGVAEPPADGWTWEEFAATSKQLTDKSKGTFGTAWPSVGDEDTVWRIWPPVWQAGGDVITEDGKVASSPSRSASPLTSSATRAPAVRATRISRAAASAGAPGGSGRRRRPMPRSPRSAPRPPRARPSAQDRAPGPGS